MKEVEVNGKKYFLTNVVDAVNGECGGCNLACGQNCLHDASNTEILIEYIKQEAVREYETSKKIMKDSYKIEMEWRKDAEEESIKLEAENKRLKERVESLETEATEMDKEIQELSESLLGYIFSAREPLKLL